MSAGAEQWSTGETEALQELAAFPLLEALFGRRSRRFALGDEIPDGPLAYRSRHEALGQRRTRQRRSIASRRLP